MDVQSRPLPDWFNEIGRPPNEIPADADRPAPLLFDAEHRPIDSVEAWSRFRPSLLDAWNSALGPRPERSMNEAVTVLEREDLDAGAVVRERIRYEVEPGFSTDAYRLGPSDAERGTRPGCVVFHSTVDHTLRQPAGLEGPPELHLGLHLARRGFVTICPENFLWRFGQRKDRFDRAMDWHNAAHPKSTGMAVMLHEARVALDIAARDPRVDPQRLGAIGHSLGAKEVLYLTALDERVSAAVFSEGGLALPDSNWDAPWYLGEQVRRPGFPLDHARLLALAAPRHFLVIGGDSADGDRSWPTIAACREVWSLFSRAPSGPSGRYLPIGLYNHRAGHRLPLPALQRGLEWLEYYLAV
jgi:dienelactone hydrolase